MPPRSKRPGRRAPQRRSKDKESGKKNPVRKGKKRPKRDRPNSDSDYKEESTDDSMDGLLEAPPKRQNQKKAEEESGEALARYFVRDSKSDDEQKMSSKAKPEPDLNYICAYSDMPNCPGRSKRLASCRHGDLVPCPNERGLHYSCQREAEKTWGVPITVGRGKLYCPSCHPDNPSKSKCNSAPASDSDGDAIHRCAWHRKFGCLDPSNDDGFSCNQCNEDGLSFENQAFVHSACYDHAKEIYEHVQDEKLSKWVYCPDCFPFQNSADAGSLPGDDSAGGEADDEPSATDGPKKRDIKSFQEHVIKEGAPTGAAETRLQRVSDIFAGKAMKLDDGTTIDRSMKLDRVRKVVHLPLNSLLEGKLLERAKKNGCYSRLKDAFKGKKDPTIKSIATPAMQLGRLLHDDQCQDDFCHHCDNELLGSYKRETRVLADCRELFDIASQTMLTKLQSERERDDTRQRRGRQAKTYPATMFRIAGMPNNFRFREDRRDPEQCPCCSHYYCIKLIAEGEFVREEQQLQTELENRTSDWRRKPIAIRGAAPRIGRAKLVQLFFCACFSLSGKKCPLCKGESSKTCPICKCRCALGPFKNEDRPHLAAAYQDYLSGRGERNYVSAERGREYAFPNLIDNALQNGARDLREANEKVTWDSVQGAASHYINEGEISEGARLKAGEDIGEPTSHLDSRHISELQAMPRGAGGHRRCKLKNDIETQKRHVVVSGGRKRVEETPTESPAKGIPLKRVKKRVRTLALRGTPGKQCAGEEILADMAEGKMSSALDRIHEGVEESEPECDDGNTPSQQIALEAVTLKKLEQKRRGL